MGRRNRRTARIAQHDSSAGEPGELPETPRGFAHRLRAFVDHPTTRLVVALILILSGFIETLDTVKEDVSHLRVRVGHGIILLGFVNAFSSLPAVIDGIERWLKVSEAQREKRRRAMNAGDVEKKPAASSAHIRESLS
jgi:hypothetical protein